MVSGKVAFSSFEDYPRMIDAENRRPKQQWWLDLRGINEALARPAPRVPSAPRPSDAGPQI
jgi:hypothetical protein